MRAIEHVAVSAGYTVAARVTVGFDGGNHPEYGDLLRCGSCGSLLRPADQELHGEYHVRLEMVAAFLGVALTGPGAAPTENGGASG